MAATDPQPHGATSRVGLILGVAAVIVILVLAVTLRSGSPPPQPVLSAARKVENEAPAISSETTREAGSDKTETAAPAPGTTTPDALRSHPRTSETPAPIPIKPATPSFDPKDLPPDHPPVQTDTATMVSIQWFGYSCFYIHSPGSVCVVTDPFDPAATRLPAPEIRAHLVTVSAERPQHNYVQAVQPFQDEAGKRQALRIVRGESVSEGDVRVQPLSTGNGNTAYLIQSGAMRILHLGHLATPLSAAQLKSLGEIHVLMLPVGDGGLKPKQAVELCQALKPRVIIPMAYATPDMRETGVRLDTVDAFVAASPYAVTAQKSDVVLLTLADLPPTTEIYTLAFRR